MNLHGSLLNGYVLDHPQKTTKEPEQWSYYIEWCNYQMVPKKMNE